MRSVQEGKGFIRHLQDKAPGAVTGLSVLTQEEKAAVKTTCLPSDRSGLVLTETISSCGEDGGPGCTPGGWGWLFLLPSVCSQRAEAGCKRSRGWPWLLPP